jgi:hypothetical protein
VIRSPYPSPGELALEIRTLCQDALAVLPMYARLHAMGMEPERGESVHVSGGGVSDTTLSAVESKVLQHRRESTRYAAKEIQRVAHKLDRLRQWLEHDIGPVAGYRQPQSIGTDAIVSVFEFAQAVEKQRDRLKRGEE